MTYDTINDARTIAGSGEVTILAGRYRIVRQLGRSCRSVPLRRTTATRSS